MSDNSPAPLTLQTAPRNAQVLMEQTSHTLRTLAYDLGRLTSGEQMMAWNPLTHQQRAELVLTGLQEWDRQNPGAYSGPAFAPGPQPQQLAQPQPTQETASPMNQPPYPPQQQFPQQPPQQFQPQAPQQPGFQQPPPGYGAPQPGFAPQAPQQPPPMQPQYAAPQAPQGGPPPPPAFTPQAQPYPQQQPQMAPQHTPQYPPQGFPQQQPPPMQPQAPQQPQMQPQGMQPPPFQTNGAPYPGGFQPPAIVPPPQPMPPPQTPPMQQQPMFPAPSGVDPAAQGYTGAATTAEAPGKTRGKREPKPAAAGASGDVVQLLTNLTAMVQQQSEEIAVLKRLTGVSAASAVTTFCSTYGGDAASALQRLLNEATVITQQLTPGKG